MEPIRLIEVAELLATASNFSVPYTKALLAPPSRTGSLIPRSTRQFKA